MSSCSCPIHSNLLHLRTYEWLNHSRKQMLNNAVEATERQSDVFKTITFCCTRIQSKESQNQTATRPGEEIFVLCSCKKPSRSAQENPSCDHQNANRYWTLTIYWIEINESAGLRRVLLTLWATPLLAIRWEIFLPETIGENRNAAPV